MYCIKANTEPLAISIHTGLFPNVLWIILPVSRTPIDMPMQDMSPVRSRACLQKGMAHIPNAVTSIENPERKVNQR